MELNLGLLRYWALPVSTIGTGDIEHHKKQRRIKSLAPCHLIQVHLSSSHLTQSTFISAHLASSHLNSFHLS